MPWAPWAQRRHPPFSNLEWRLAALENALDAVTQAVTLSVEVPSLEGGNSIRKAVFWNLAAADASRRAFHREVICGTAVGASVDSSSESQDAELEVSCSDSNSQLFAAAARGPDTRTCASCPLARASAQLLISDQLHDLSSLDVSRHNSAEVSGRTAAPTRSDSSLTEQEEEAASSEGSPCLAVAAAPVVTMAAGPESCLRICISASVSPLHNVCVRTLLDASPLGVAVSLTNGDLEWISSTMTAATGVSLHRLSGRGWEAVVHPDDTALVSEAWSSAIATGTFPDIEFRIASSSSEPSTPAVGAAANAPEAPHHDDAKRASGATGTIDYAPPESTDGRRVGTVHGRMPQSDQPLSEPDEPVRAYSNSEDSKHWRWYSSSCRALRDPRSGEILRWIGMLTDVHEKRVLEQKLAAEKALFLTAIDQLPVSVIVVDAPSGAVRLANKQTADVWRQEMFDGNKIDYSRFVAFHPDGRPYGITDWPLARSILYGEVVTKEDTIVQRGDGTRGIIRLSSAPVHDANGDVVAAVVSCEDVTELLQAQENRTRMLAAEQAAQQLSQLVSNVSHELRTPLHGILGMAELLSSSAMTAEQRECVETIQGSGRLLLTVIGDLLDHEKMRAGKLTLEALPFRLQAVMDDALALVVDGSRKKGVALERSCRSALPEGCCLIGDAQRFKQLLLNLLNNAVRFTPAGGRISLICNAQIVPGHHDELVGHSSEEAAENELHQLGDHGDDVRFLSRSVSAIASNRASGDLQHLRRPEPNLKARVRVVVSDTGIGMDGSTLSRLFKPWSQADASTTRRYGGTGLGLAICRELLTLMGGTISADSEGPGQGSTFRIDVTLPAAPCPDQLPAAPCRRDSGSAPPAVAADAEVRALPVANSMDAHALLTGQLPVGHEHVSQRRRNTAGTRTLAAGESLPHHDDVEQGRDSARVQDRDSDLSFNCTTLADEATRKQASVLSQPQALGSLMQPQPDAAAGSSHWQRLPQPVATDAASSSHSADRMSQPVQLTNSRLQRPAKIGGSTGAPEEVTRRRFNTAPISVSPHLQRALRSVEACYRPIVLPPPSQAESAGVDCAPTHSSAEQVDSAGNRDSSFDDLIGVDGSLGLPSILDSSLHAMDDSAEHVVAVQAAIAQAGSLTQPERQAVRLVGTDRSVSDGRRSTIKSQAASEQQNLAPEQTPTTEGESVFGAPGRSRTSHSITLEQATDSRCHVQRQLEHTRVLLVEDTAVNALLAKRMLRSGGVADVTHVENGELAVAAVRDDEPYDMVLMDCQMPVLDGYEATRRIRALPDPVRSQVPIIALTASALEVDVRRCRDVGMNDHLSKPHTAAALLDMVRNWTSPAASPSD